MTTSERAQIGFGEEPLENEVLEAALEDWGERKNELKPVRKAFQAIDRTVKAIIDQAELADGTYRCGRFIIKLSHSEEVYIEFERASTKRYSIKPAVT